MRPLHAPRQRIAECASPLAPLVAALLLSPTAAAVVPPTDFVIENAVPVGSFVVPTALAFLPDGRWLVAEKGGRISIVEGGTQHPSPLVDLQDEVLSNGDRGLTAIAVDPNHTTNRFLYLLYTVDPDSNGVDDDAHGFGRLTRYQISASDPYVVDPGSRTILLGTDWASGPPSASSTHTVNDLRWGADGSLLVSMGDGAHTNVDQGGQDPEVFAPGRVDPLQDIGAFRAQDPASLCGKILRIDPATGHGYPGNPFWDGDPGSAASRVWATGLRNPFRFSVRPGSGNPDPLANDPGALFIGDVGWATWEELDLATQGGLNFGWPCYEGDAENPTFQSATPAHHGCSTFLAPQVVATHAPPLLTYHHSDSLQGTVPGFPGNCVIGGPFYSGSRYPATYQGALFFADFGRSLIRVAHFDTSHQIASLTDFATEAENPVAIAADPANGDILYVSITTSQVRRIRYVPPGPNVNPIAVASATPARAEVPVSVQFSSAESFDPDGDPLTFFWDFGNGDGSSTPSPLYTYVIPGVYPVQLLALDGRGGTARDSIWVVAAASMSFPGTPIVDDFNRPNGPMGGPWIGDLTPFLLIGGALQQAGADSSLAVWSGAIPGSNQEAYVTLATLAPGAAYRLVLKLQGTTSGAARIEATWNAATGLVSVASYDPASGWQSAGSPVATAFSAGDTLGARAWITGEVEVFRNRVTLGAWSVAGTTLAEAGGRIGIGLVQAAQSQLDDFGGGDMVIDPNTPPVATILAPGPGTFFIAGVPVQLAGTATDAEDDSTGLIHRWEVDLIHNTHVHPQVRVIEGSSGILIPENHEDGTGFHYELRYIVADQGGKRDTAFTRIDPSVDLAPSAVATQPETLIALGKAAFGFRIRNHGGMPAPITRWTLTAGATVIAGGDTAVPAVDSVTVSGTVFHNLLPGTHSLVITTDADGVLLETNETNNTRSRPIVVRNPVLPAYPATPIRDNFNRNGSLGPPWAGITTGLTLGGRLECTTQAYRGPVWNAQTFGPYQEAYVLLERFDRDQRLGVILKAQGDAFTSGRIEVRYEDDTGIEVRTYSAGTGWIQHGATIAVQFQGDDRIGARAFPDGNVEVYRNNTLIGLRSVAGWPFAAMGGLIGVTFENANDTRLEDFGGGSIGPTGPPPNQAPTAKVTAAPVTGTVPFLVRFSSTGSADPDGDPLFPLWTFGDDSTSAKPDADHTYVAAGTYLARLLVDDGRGATATDSVVITALPSAGFPAAPVLDEFDRPDEPLGPPWAGSVAGIAVIAGSYGPTASGYHAPVFDAGFGSVQEAYVRLLALTPGAAQQGLVLKAQDTTLQSAKIEVRYRQIFGDVAVATHVPGEGWTDWGSIPLPLAAFDVLGARALPDGAVQVYRNGILAGTVSVASWPHAAAGGFIGLNEDGGIATRFDDFGGGTVTTLAVEDGAGIASGLPVALALSRAFPNPSRGAVAFGIEMPRGATLRWTVRDIQGRSVWTESRELQPGRWTLAWPGTTSTGTLAAPGLYFADVMLDGRRASRRFVLAR